MYMADVGPVYKLDKIENTSWLACERLDVCGRRVGECQTRAGSGLWSPVSAVQCKAFTPLAFLTFADAMLHGYH